MYREFYNLREDPFNVTSDPEFFFESSRHAEAFSHLTYGIQQRKGIIVITGEIGTGKTTLCRTLLTRLTSNVKTALILNPHFSGKQLLEIIVKDLDIAGNFRNKLSLHNALNEFLLEQSSQGNNVVLIIDEAQNLTVGQLEQIRLLSNLETEKTKLLQIILVGQPELLKKLKLSTLRQLNQRISVRYHILPLEPSEVHDYIHHRLKVASGFQNARLPPPVHFTKESVETISLYSKGIPRLINILCDRALLSGYVNATDTITEQLVCSCAKEVAYQ